MNKLFKKIIDSNTINLTTFKKSGVEVHTPVWVVNDEEYGYVRTYFSSGKVKRIMNNHKITLATCTSSGKVIGNKVSGTNTNPNNANCQSRTNKEMVIASMANGSLIASLKPRSKHR